jgi:type I restriction enzyme R subunit
LNLGESLGVAVREYPLRSGPTDYLLFVDRKAVGVVEAKPVGTTLSGIAEQTSTYLSSIPDDVPYDQLPLPFAYETTGIETYFRDLRDPNSRSRRVFAFHKPETQESLLTLPPPPPLPPFSSLHCRCNLFV